MGLTLYESVILPLLETEASVKMQNIYMLAFTYLPCILEKISKKFQKLLNMISEVPTHIHL